MTLPVTGRVSELKRTGAWPLVCHAAGTGQVRLDLALIGAKHLAGLASAVETRDPAAFAARPGCGIAAGLEGVVDRDGAGRVPGRAAGLARRSGR